MTGEPFGLVASCQPCCATRHPEVSPKRHDDEVLKALGELALAAG
ncbi:MAG: hypothetical protein ACR2H2_02845 [Solirubrobacteraceae bacterium]